MFDTHSHLNFEAFSTSFNDIIDRSFRAGVNYIVIPGTDIISSHKAVEIASRYNTVYAAAGIHPHHVFENLELPSSIESSISELIPLLEHPKVVAVGEIGLDRHLYERTKYKNYHADSRFINLQKQAFIKQVQLGIAYKKSLILHNREATDDILPLLETHWDTTLQKRTVFHCCEPRQALLNYAKQKRIYIGIDGDITYDKSKQSFIKDVPLDLLVLETDSPYLVPEPLRSQKIRPNTSANLTFIAEFIAHLLNMKKEDLLRITTENAKELFNIKS